MELDDDSSGSDGYNSEEEEAYNEEDLTEDPSKTEPKNYTIITESDIRRHQEEAISEVCTVLTVPRSAAVVLLLHHQWSVHKLQEAWFADEEAVRKAVGLQEPKTPKAEGSAKCGICFRKKSFRNISSANCGHYYCKRCWKRYIAAAVENGSGCLTLRCPEPSCLAAVGQDLIDCLAKSADKEKYGYFLVRSFVELGRETKWCPAPGCEKAVEFVGGGGSHDVYCDCSNGFCSNCDEEAHSPMDCKTVMKWIAKNSSESLNTAWIVANSKPCPKCRRPIEKNRGCMHMTCTKPCRHQFCWTCLQDWRTHTSCNSYKAISKDGEFEEVRKKRRLARTALEKYTHYYERWAANHKSWTRSLKDIQRVKTETIQELSVLKNLPVEEMEFVVDAWKQVVECRRVLKWTYAYGYYLPKKETMKKQLFEFVQGEAEAALERLHDFTEQEVKKQLNLDIIEAESGKKMVLDENGDIVPVDTFEDFRKRLMKLTSVTRDYFEKLVTALEKGLLDVQEEGGNQHLGEKGLPDVQEGGNQHLGDGWPCDRCTYMNSMDAIACVMCSIPDAGVE